MSDPENRVGGLGSDLVVIVGGFLVLGLIGGVAWHLLAHPAYFTKVKSGGEMGEVELGKRFATDGWYVVIALVAGIPSGLGMTWWRSRDPLATALLCVAGSVVAAASMAWVGLVLGPGDPQAALAKAAVHARVPTQTTLSAHVAYLSWPLAVVIGTLMVLLSSPLDRAGRLGESAMGGADGAGNDSPVQPRSDIASG